MKKLYTKAVAALLIAGSMTSCGDSFLDTDIYNGIDSDTGLNSVTKINVALNGAYYRLFYYPFAGNYAISIGDIPTDITYWNQKTSHWNSFYQFSYTDTDSYLLYIWNYGYKVIDHSSRVIQAAKAIYDNSSASEQAELSLAMAEAYSLRGYASLILTNVFGHQVKVNGTDFSSQPGIVVVDEPISATDKVNRSTVGESYEAIINDLKNAIAQYEIVGADQGSLFYFGKASTYGLLARASLYLENYSDAITYAQNAIDESGITELHYTAAGYKALYNGGNSNTESMFALDITESQNWSANSCGTLWTSYSYSPSPYLLSLYGENDVRRSIMDFGSTSTSTIPVYGGGKFAAFASGNPAYATNYIVNAPEMFLIMAEANVRKSSPDVNAAKEALLVVAKRNLDITSTADLPANATQLLSFIKDERARELFQEGHRFWDLRRWDESANLSATGAPNVDYLIKAYQVSNIVFPIPADEINTGSGVEQTPNWGSTRPTL